MWCNRVRYRLGRFCLLKRRLLDLNSRATVQWLLKLYGCYHVRSLMVIITFQLAPCPYHLRLLRWVVVIILASVRFLGVPQLRRLYDNSRRLLCCCVPTLNLLLLYRWLHSIPSAFCRAIDSTDNHVRYLFRLLSISHVFIRGLGLLDQSAWTIFDHN